MNEHRLVVYGLAQPSPSVEAERDDLVAGVVALFTELVLHRRPSPTRSWVGALLAANVLPLLWWGRVESWARHSLGLYAGQ